ACCSFSMAYSVGAPPPCGRFTTRISNASGPNSLRTPACCRISWITLLCLAFMPRAITRLDASGSPPMTETSGSNGVCMFTPCNALEMRVAAAAPQGRRFRMPPSCGQKETARRRLFGDGFQRVAVGQQGQQFRRALAPVELDSELFQPLGDFALGRGLAAGCGRHQFGNLAA